MFQRACVTKELLRPTLTEHWKLRASGGRVILGVWPIVGCPCSSGLLAYTQTHIIGLSGLLKQQQNPHEDGMGAMWERSGRIVGVFMIKTHVYMYEILKEKIRIKEA